MSIGLERGIVELKTYNPEWVVIANNFINKLNNNPKEEIIDIQHIGSTSIESLMAKPIIDIVIGVENLGKISNLTKKLNDLGFYRSNRHKVMDDILFCDGDSESIRRSFHIHIVKYESPEWIDYIRFRDYLRFKKSELDFYNEKKIILQKKYAKDRLSYNKEKGKVVSEILERSKKWREPKSIGMIVYRRIEKEIEFLLLLQKQSNTWSFPKGHVEGYEREIETAKREVFEETALELLPIDDHRYEVKYFQDEDVLKTVVLFLAEAENLPIMIQKSEIIEYRWVSKEEAKSLFSYRCYDNLMDKVLKDIELIN